MGRGEEEEEEEEVHVEEEEGEEEEILDHLSLVSSPKQLCKALQTLTTF